MSPAEIQSMLKREPFVPFRICLSDQREYPIDRPYLVWVGNRETWIGLVRETASPFFDEAVIVSNIHITRLEPIVPLVSPPKSPTA